MKRIFSAGVDFLAWQTKSSDNDFINIINIDSDPPSVYYQEFEYNFEPGYRLFLKAQPHYSSWEFMASYEEVHANDKQSFISDAALSANSPLTFDPGPILYLNASATSRHHYQAAEIAAYYNVCLPERHLFRPLVAIQYLELKREIHFSGITDIEKSMVVDFLSHYRALGLTLGTEYVYKWLYDLEMYAKGAVILNVGSLRTKIKRLSDDPAALSTQFHGHTSPLVPELRCCYWP